jgi:UDP-N-acetylmuramate dehydrogenase
MSVEFLRDADLQPFNTFGLPGRAQDLLRVDSEDTVRAAMADAAWQRGPKLVLGGGSNLILTQDVSGLVLKVEVMGRRLAGEDNEAWYVEAGGGEDWHAFVRWTLERGWPGLENLSLIPGTVGAAPVQNIGAYGLEMGERFASLDALDLASGALRHFDRAACRFGYRDSVFKQEAAGRYLILRVLFRLPKAWVPCTGYADVAQVLAERGLTQPGAADVSDAVIAIRRRKLPDPAQIGNAGSFFKNPLVDAGEHARLAAQHPGMPAYRQADGTYKLAAGWLIDQCGWKGRRLGPVGTHARQALVLVNHGGACGADVLRLAEAIQADVATRFGVCLEPEPVFI